MAIWYVSTGQGCTIVEARTEQSARKQVLRDVGECAGVKEVRKAMLVDVDWVLGMGGSVPKNARTTAVKQEKRALKEKENAAKMVGHYQI